MNTPLIPKVARRYARLASTNTAAVEALNDGEDLPPGAVFWADAQTAGRGQGANRWHASPNANLSLSIVVYPDHLAVDQLFALTQVSALAVAETVRSLLPASLTASVRVKWPNDVYVGDRKIAGILVQNGLRGSRVAWSVIGIGLNVNEAIFPTELRATATSLRLLTGKVWDRERVGECLFTAFGATYGLLDAPELGQRYLELLYRRGVVSSFLVTASGERISGVILGVDAQGRLRLALAEGERAFALRELRLSIG
ncbi:MAG: biotin--[acetyl-CoA-carboxylase] ligase [Bacteroidota bacterium]